MQHFLSRISFLFIFLISVNLVFAQDPTSVDPALIDLENARIPKEYTVKSIQVTGTTFLDTAIIISISNIQVGDKIVIPGGDAFSKAVSNLWRQRLFSNINIYITDLQGDQISLEINVQERPKLGNFKFEGIKKTEAEELQGKIGLAKSTIITENTRRNATEVIQKFYRDKGFMNVQIRIEEKPFPAMTNANEIVFHIDKGRK
ncbi:MAG: POTRA domain-containing protein, partial [Chitinophagaceae bacterium]